MAPPPHHDDDWEEEDDDGRMTTTSPCRSTLLRFMTAPSAATTAADPWSSVKRGKQRCVRLCQGHAGTAPILYCGFCRLNALTSREVTIWRRRRWTMMMVTASAAALLLPMDAGRWLNGDDIFCRRRPMTMVTTSAAALLLPMNADLLT